MKLIMNLMIDEEDEKGNTFASSFEINEKSMISNKKIISNIAQRLWREVMRTHKFFIENGMKPIDVKEFKKLANKINYEENLHVHIGIDPEKIINELDNSSEISTVTTDNEKDTTIID